MHPFAEPLSPTTRRHLIEKERQRLARGIAAWSQSWLKSAALSFVLVPALQAAQARLTGQGYVARPLPAVSAKDRCFWTQELGSGCAELSQVFDDTQSGDELEVTVAVRLTSRASQCGELAFSAYAEHKSRPGQRREVRHTIAQAQDFEAIEGYLVHVLFATNMLTRQGFPPIFDELLRPDS